MRDNMAFLLGIIIGIFLAGLLALMLSHLIQPEIGSALKCFNTNSHGLVCVER